MTESTEDSASSPASGKTLTKERTNLTKSVTKKKRRNKQIGVGIGASIVALLIIILPIIIMKLKKAPLKAPLETPKAIPIPVKPVPTSGPIPSSWYTPNKNIELPKEAYDEIQKLNLQREIDSQLFFPKEFTEQDKKYALMARILGAANEMEGLFPADFVNEQTAILNKIAKWVKNPPEKEGDAYKLAGYYVASVHHHIRIEKKFQQHQNLTREDFQDFSHHLQLPFGLGFDLGEKFPDNPYLNSLAILHDAMDLDSFKSVINNMIFDHKSEIGSEIMKSQSKRVSVDKDVVENVRKKLRENPDFKPDGFAGIMLEAFSSIANKYM